MESLGPSLGFGQVFLALAGASVAGTLLFNMILKRHEHEQVQSALIAVLEFVFMLGIVYFAECIRFLPTSERHYDRDFFVFALLTVLLVALATVRRNSTAAASSVDNTQVPAVTVPLLPREISEEWKGWMQVIILLYHYTHAVEAYNAIRVIVSAYFWLMGFGHGKFFLRERTVSLKRLLNVMWRLNFVTFGLMAVTGNNYINYYFVPMASLSTLLTFAIFAIWPSANQREEKVLLKVAAAVAVSYVLWEFEGVFRFVFRPLSYVMGPGNPSATLHELHFRTYLDHYATISGIVFAVFANDTAKWLQKLEEGGKARIILVGAAWSGIVAVWVYWVLHQPTKVAYNALHPYTAIIPILAYVLLRCWSSLLRSFHLPLFRFVGGISLELYVLQYHLWLNQNAKKLLVIVPGYPLLNLLFVSTLFVICCVHCSRITGSLWASLSCHAQVRRALGLLGALAFGTATVFAILRTLVSTIWILLGILCLFAAVAGPAVLRIRSA